MIMNLIFLGAPGSGKGTQAEILEKEKGLIKLSTGDMLRAAVAQNTELGKAAQAIMERGELVPDAIMIEMIRERIVHSDCKRGFILDGFPRTVAQAEALDEMLKEACNSKITKVIEITVNEEMLIERVCGRFSCAKCGAGYHDKFKMPKVKDTCDNCGSHEFVRRKDDNEKTIRTRLAAYHRQTEPLKPYYEKQGVLAQVDGMQDIAQVTAQIHKLAV